MLLAKYRISTNAPYIVLPYLHLLLYLNIVKLYEICTTVILILQMRKLRKLERQYLNTFDLIYYYYYFLLSRMYYFLEL